MAESPDPEGGERSRRAVLVGLLVMVVLVVAAVYLWHALREESRLEDCLMSGRTNCAPIAVPAERR
jgi:hypothetical protein